MMIEDQDDVLTSLEDKIRCLPSVLTQDEAMAIIDPLLELVISWKAQAEGSLKLIREYENLVQSLMRSFHNNNEVLEEYIEYMKESTEIMRENIEMSEELIGGEYGVSARITIGKFLFE